MGLPDMEEELARYQATKKILDRCPILRERLTEEKAVLYQQLWEANREIRTARKQLALCRKIQDHAPQMERDTQAAEGRLDSRNKNVSITKRPQAASNRPPGPYDEHRRLKESTYKHYDELPLFLSAAMVAQVLGISTSSSYALLHSKGFPTLRVGGRMAVPGTSSSLG